jgi:hypothetical protein
LIAALDKAKAIIVEKHNWIVGNIGDVGLINGREYNYIMGMGQIWG